VPTFLGAHDIPPEYKSRREEYISLLTNEMLPRVAQEKLAEYCDVFCEEKVFTLDESRQILSAARSQGLGLRMHADQLALSGGAKLAGEIGTVTADHLDSSSEVGGRAAGTFAGIGLCARFDSLSRGARDDRGGIGGSARHRFQSRVFANPRHADDSFPGLDAPEDDPGRIHHRCHRQPRLHTQPRRQNRIT